MAVEVLHPDEKRMASMKVSLIRNHKYSLCFSSTYPHSPSHQKFYCISVFILKNTVNPFNFAASKFCIFKGSKFHCFKKFFLVVLICYNDEQIYSRILLFTFL